MAPMATIANQVIKLVISEHRYRR